MRFGDWETRQHRSSFAIKLPHNWWIWGADIQLNDLLDPGQLSYFRAVAEQMGPEDRFILCTAEPSWYALGTPAERFARQNLNGLIEAPIRRGAKLCGIFSGDWHHYSRYNESQALGNMNLITAGGAGAYIHGTYHLKRKLDFEWVGKTLEFRLDRKLEPSSSDTEPPKQTTANACYPSKATSYRLALGNWLFPFRNFGFCLAVGIVYWLLTWTFATLRVDFWLEVPKEPADHPRSHPDAARPFENVSTADAAEQRAAAAHGAATCRSPATSRRVCSTPAPERNGYRPFNGTGRIEDWTLQLIDFYSRTEDCDVLKQMAQNTGFLFLKGVHLLLLGMINSVGAALFLFGIWFAFFAITQSKYRGKRGLASRVVVATLHHGTHLLFMWALYCAFAYFNNTWLERHLDTLGGDSSPGCPVTAGLPDAAARAGAVLGELHLPLRDGADRRHAGRLDLRPLPDGHLHLRQGELRLAVLLPAPRRLPLLPAHEVRARQAHHLPDPPRCRAAAHRLALAAQPGTPRAAGGADLAAQAAPDRGADRDPPR